MTNIDASLAVSIVIGFRDWGLERLSVCLRELVRQTDLLNGEVIVSDFGSTDPKSVSEVCERYGARHIYTETTEPWSRARALNAGFARSTGEILIATDADMLFSPEAVSGIVNRLTQDSHQFLVLQCRDLPQELGADAFGDSKIDWERLDLLSRFRPRYGMGGMIAFSREAFLAIRGFDERMQVYGGEDMDFAERLRRYGLPLVWIDQPSVRMYHIWHPSSRKTAEESASTKIYVQRNSKIVTDDSSYVRNLTSWRYAPSDAKPLATVVICTRDRCDFLEQALVSVFSQTTRDIQVIVVDDGSSDGTADMLNSIPDERLLVLRQDAEGIAKARNLALQHTRSDFTVIFDDDDLMCPTRIEDHFKALTGEVDGTYGAWVDFDDIDHTKFKLNPGKGFTDDIINFMGEVYVHGALMLPTAFIRAALYDPTFRSGSDYNLAVRLQRMGLSLRHTGTIAIARRLHRKGVTHSDKAYQQSSWATTKALGLFSISKPQFNFIQKRETTKSKKIELNMDAKSAMDGFGPDTLSGSAIHFSNVRDAPLSESQGGIPKLLWRVIGPNGPIAPNTGRIQSPSLADVWNVVAWYKNWWIEPGGKDNGTDSVHSEKKQFLTVLDSIASNFIDTSKDTYDKSSPIVCIIPSSTHGLKLNGKKYRIEHSQQSFEYIAFYAQDLTDALNYAGNVSENLPILIREQK